MALESRGLPVYHLLSHSSPADHSQDGAEDVGDLDIDWSRPPRASEGAAVAPNTSSPARQQDVNLSTQAEPLFPNDFWDIRPPQPQASANLAQDTPDVGPEKHVFENDANAGASLFGNLTSMNASVVESSPRHDPFSLFGGSSRVPQGQTEQEKMSGNGFDFDWPSADALSSQSGDRSGPPPSPTPDPTSVSLYREGSQEEQKSGQFEEDDEGTRYELRIAARGKILTCGSTWLDKDNSGDYDPTRKENVLPQNLVKRKRRTATNAGDRRTNEAEPAPKKSKSWRSGRMNGDVCIITLSLTSPAGVALLAKYPSNYPHGYNESWNSLLDDDESNPDETAKHDDGPSSRLRNRATSSTRFNRSLTTQPYGLLRFDDTTDLAGQPAARGCKACRNLRQVCPMLEPGGTYPCYLCIEDECDCELVVPPLKKRSCEHCKKRRVRCSYRDDDDHAGPCHGCQEAGYYCIAGPAIDSTRTRIGDDGKPATIHEREPEYRRTSQGKEPKQRCLNQPQGRHLTCVSCRETGIRCSLRRPQLASPCINCKIWGLTCQLNKEAFTPLDTKRVHFRDGKKLQIQSKTPDTATKIGQLAEDSAEHFANLAAAAVAEAPTARKPSPSVSRRYAFADLFSSAQFAFNFKESPGHVTTIHTRLVHPITFNHPADDKPCHWCTDPVFGLIGIGDAIDVEVRQWPNGKGCTELSRRHKEGVLEPGRMCFDCTTERVSVLTCDCHSLRRIDQSRYRPTSLDSALEALLDSPPASLSTIRKELQSRFCSICNNLAIYACCTRPDLGDQASGERASGCGLRLCEACEYLLQDVYNGNLSEMVEKIRVDEDSEEDKEFYPYGLRADYDFYKEEGWLVKQVLD